MSSSEQDQLSPGFRLVSFNVHVGGFHPDRIHRYDLSGAFAELGGDIVVMQEMTDDAPLAAGEFTEKLVLFPPECHPKHGQISTIVSSRYPILERREIIVGAHGGWDPRDRVMALHIDGPEGRFWLVAVHLSTGLLPLGSFLQAIALSKQLPEGPLVVVGDHNLWGPSLAVAFAGTGLRRAVKGRTWPAVRPHSQIDHIWTRGLVTEGGKVHRNVGSDHRPISSRLRFK